MPANQLRDNRGSRQCIVSQARLKFFLDLKRYSASSATRFGAQPTLCRLAKHAPMPAPELVIDYAPRTQFVAFHDRTERFACIVTHRRAGKTVACIHHLQRAASECRRMRPRFAYLSPFLKQSKAVAWDYLRAAMAPLRAIGASAHETELRVDYPSGGQVRLYGAGTSCRTMPRPRSSAPARAGSRCSKVWASRTSASPRCIGWRTASTPCAWSCRNAG